MLLTGYVATIGTFAPRPQQDDPSNEQAVTWRAGKYHAVRLYDISTGEVFAATQKMGIIVTYEIWRGHHKASCSLLLVPVFSR